MSDDSFHTTMHLVTMLPEVFQSHEKTTALLSIKSWLLNRDPYNYWFIVILKKNWVVSHALYTQQTTKGHLYHCSHGFLCWNSSQKSRRNLRKGDSPRSAVGAALTEVWESVEMWRNWSMMMNGDDDGDDDDDDDDHNYEWWLMILMITHVLMMIMKNDESSWWMMMVI